ncbi:MAG: response regulator [Leptolyngbyaceae cyanobacterium]
MIKTLLHRLPQIPPDRPDCRILVVDDNPVNRTLLVRLLRRSGFTVCQATNGSDAVTLWRQWQPQLILMDLLMPGLDGRAATRLIRKAEKKQPQLSTVIVALTAEPVYTCLADGFDSIIAKPIRSDIVLDLIARHLDLQYVEDISAASRQPVSAQTLN